MSKLSLGPTTPPIQEVLWSISPKIKLGLEADYSPPPSAEFKNEWSYAATSYTPTCIRQGKFNLFSNLKQVMMDMINFYLDLGLMKILLQNWVWNNAAFITCHANITLSKEVSNSIKAIVTI